MIITNMNSKIIAIIAITFLVSSIGSITVADAIVSTCAISPLPQPTNIWTAICDLQSQVNVLRNSINVERVARQTGDTNISNSLTTEINNRISADSLLDTRVSQNELNISNINTAEILRFEPGIDSAIRPEGRYFNNDSTYTANSIDDALLASSLSGINGNLTHLRYHIGISNSNGNMITATVFINGVSTSASCSLISSSTPSDCTWDGNIPILEGDLIAIHHFTSAGGSFEVGQVKAFVSITPP